MNCATVQGNEPERVEKLRALNSDAQTGGILIVLDEKLWIRKRQSKWSRSSGMLCMSRGISVLVETDQPKTNQLDFPIHLQ